MTSEIRMEALECVWLSLSHNNKSTLQLDRVTPCLKAIELTLQLVLGHHNEFSKSEVNASDELNQEELIRVLDAQLGLLRSIIQVDMVEASTQFDYATAEALSKASVFQLSDNRIKISMENEDHRNKCIRLIQHHFDTLPFGIGLTQDHVEHLQFDAIVQPHDIQHHFDQDKALAMAWIINAWLGAIGLQLQAARIEYKDLMSSNNPQTTLARISKRLWICTQVFNFFTHQLMELDGSGSTQFGQSIERSPHMLQCKTLIQDFFIRQLQCNSQSPASMADVIALLMAKGLPSLNASKLTNLALKLINGANTFFQQIENCNTKVPDVKFNFGCAFQETQMTASPYRAAFSKSLALQEPNTLHFSTYGMGLAPDVSFESVKQTHEFLTKNLNEIWPSFFEHDIRQAEHHVLTSLGLHEPHELYRFHVNFGSNVHEFLLRLFSCLDPSTKCEIVSSDAEFVSLTRQLAAWSESVIVHTVSLRPFESFGDRLRRKIAEVQPHVVHVSAVYSNTQYRFPDAEVQATLNILPHSTMCILDVAQALQNVPMSLPHSPSLVVVGSGVKHATAGPGMGFVAFPRALNDNSGLWTPRNTGWIAHLGSMTRPQTIPVEYTAELKFAGGTPGFHYALRQLNDVQSFYERQGWTLAARHAYVLKLQTIFLVRLGPAVDVSTTIGRPEPQNCSNAIVLTHSRVESIHRDLANAVHSKNVFHCDVRRSTCLRLGFGLHHIDEEVNDLADAIVAAWKSLDTLETIKLVV